MTDPISALKQIENLAQAGLAYVPPAPAPVAAPLDLAEWWIPKAGKFTRPAYTRLLADGRLAVYYLKTTEGWPWDINVIDNTGVYFRVTENDAKDKNGSLVGWPPLGSPKSYRLYELSHADTPSRGFKISPRFYDPSKGRVLVSDVNDSPGRRFSDCGNSLETHLGPAQSYVSLVKGVQYGGSLGTQDTIVCEYFYTRVLAGEIMFKKRERFYLVQGPGWTLWDLSNLGADNKTYTVISSSPHIQFIPDTLQVPVFPCNVVL